MTVKHLHPVHRVVYKARAFHMSWKWLAALLVSMLLVSLIFGFAEFWKGLFGLIVEQIMLHLGAWEKLAATAEEVVEN